MCVAVFHSQLFSLHHTDYLPKNSASHFTSLFTSLNPAFCAVTRKNGRAGAKMCATKTKREVCKNEPNDFSSLKTSRLWRESSIRETDDFQSQIALPGRRTNDRSRSGKERAVLLVQLTPLHLSYRRGFARVAFLPRESIA